MPRSHGFSRGWGKESEKKSLSLSFYRRYTAMRSRCLRKTASDYPYYGGRGIKLEFSSFDEFHGALWGSFITHVMEYGITNTTLDRIDPNGSYSHKNCRWATRQEQGKNTRKCRIINVGDISDTILGWSKRSNIPNSTISRRIDKYGWTPEEAVTTPAPGIHWKRGLTNPHMKK